MFFVDHRHLRHIIIRLVVANLMVISGAGIYITARHYIIFFRWIPASVINSFQEYTINDSSPLGYLIVYCLPDGLWYGALLLLQSTLIGRSYASKVIYRISIALPFVWEILQIHNAVPGTFDPLDLCTYLVILFLFISFIQKNHE